uniref:Transposase_23 domain-containing protein n=1 Tax=Heterorhabditis bacteriophora TaxID=37862 RepID=A0A1I7X6Q2_HETBA
MTEKSKQRRQMTIEKEGSERRFNDRKSQTSKRRVKGVQGISHKGETEEQKRLRLGTIFTANDYVSTIDMSDERPWPMTGLLIPTQYKAIVSNPVLGTTISGVKIASFSYVAHVSRVLVICTWCDSYFLVQ